MDRAQLLQRRAELQRELANVDEELAAHAARDAQAAPAGWISQRTSPLGKRGHLVLWRRLRDAGSDGARAFGKARLIRADVFAASLEANENSNTTRSRRRACNGQRVDLAQAFGV